MVVLSNNDGCVVARSAEVKALGIPMGVPWFKIQDEARRHGIVALQLELRALCGHEQPGASSILAAFSPNIEVYSIDECFLELSGFEPAKAMTAYGRDHAPADG